MIQKFAIMGRLAGYNEYVNAAHTPWKRTKLKQEQEAIVIEAAKAAGIKHAQSPVAVYITYYEGKAEKGQRVRDLDNVIGGGNKFILDALVSMGVLDDDSPNFVPRLYVRGFKATREPRIEITIESE